MDDVLILVFHYYEKPVIWQHMESGAPIKSQLEVLFIDDNYLVRLKFWHSFFENTGLIFNGVIGWRYLFLLEGLGPIHFFDDLAKGGGLDLSEGLSL